MYSNLIHDYSKSLLIHVYIKIKRILLWPKNTSVTFSILTTEMVDSKKKLASPLSTAIHVRFVNFTEVHGRENCAIDCLRILTRTCHRRVLVLNFLPPKTDLPRRIMEVS